MAITATVASLNALSAAYVEGCQPVAGSITESSAFTAFGNTFGIELDRPINPEGVPSAATADFVPPTMDSLPVSWAAEPRGDITASYYLDKPIGSTLTRPEFFVDGGLLFRTTPADPSAGSYATAIEAQLGDRAMLVKIGQVDGVLTWGDPMSNGVRPHQISWSSAGLIYSIIAERSAERIVGLAREFAC